MSCFDIPGDMALNADESDCTFVEGLDAVRQQITAGAQVLKGQWVFDRNKGIDLLDNVFEKNPDLRLVQLAFYEFLMSVPGVISADPANLRIDTATRTLFITYTIETDFGPLADSLELNFGV